EDHVILSRQGRRVGDVNVGKCHLPSQDFVELGNRSEVKGSAVVTGAVEVGKEVELLVERGAFPKFVHQFFAERERDQIAVEQIIVFARVVQATEEIESRRIALDCVIAGAAAENRAKVQGLQFVGEEIRGDKTKDPFRYIVIVTKASAFSVGRGGR